MKPYLKWGILCYMTVFFLSCQATSEKVTSSPKEAQVPFMITPEAGKEWNVFGVKITGKVMSEQTNGKYSVIVTETPPQGGPPPHVHEHEDELFYVLKGNFVFYCGEKEMKAQEGSLVSLPRGIPHHFKNVDSTLGITMNTITPGGFEGFFETVANLSKKQKPSRAQIDSVAHLYGLSFIKK